MAGNSEMVMPAEKANIRLRQHDSISPRKVLIWRNLKFLLIASDLLAFFIAFAIGELVLTSWKSVSVQDTGHGWVFLLAFLTTSISITWFWQLGHYVRRKPFWDELRETSRAISLLFLNAGLVLFLSNPGFPRTLFVISWASTFVLIPSFRYLLKSLLTKIGGWQLPTVILGSGKNALDATLALSSEKLMGFQIEAFLAVGADSIPESGHLEVQGRKIPVHPLGNDPIRKLEEMGRPNLVVALESGGIATFTTLIEALHRYSEKMYIVPALRGIPLFGMEMSHFFRHEVILLKIRNNLARPFSRFLKRSFDVAGSAFLLLLLSPLFAFLAWKIRKDSGPVFFGHARIGQEGETFKCYKFRSMVPNAQNVLQDLLASDPQARAEWERDFKLKNDPRITPVGAFLRRTSLDELPQLWNVLKGEMSLVGPRPIVRDEFERYKESIHYYLHTKPGMTGLWQISGRNDIDYDNRVYLDSWYVKNWSIWYDVAILFKTIGVVLNRKGAY